MPNIRNCYKKQNKSNKETEISKLEDRVKTIENQIREIEKFMEIYDSNYEELSKLYKNKEELSNELDILFEDLISI